MISAVQEEIVGEVDLKYKVQQVTILHIRVQMFLLILFDIKKRGRRTLLYTCKVELKS